MSCCCSYPDFSGDNNNVKNISEAEGAGGADGEAGGEHARQRGRGQGGEDVSYRLRIHKSHHRLLVT